LNEIKALEAKASRSKRRSLGGLDDEAPELHYKAPSQ